MTPVSHANKTDTCSGYYYVWVNVGRMHGGNVKAKRITCKGL